MQAVIEQCPVGQSGQFIVGCQILDALLRLAHRGNVAEHADVVDHLAAFVLDGIDRQPFKESLAVLAAIPDLALPDAQAIDPLPHFDVELGRRLFGSQKAGLPADDLLAGEPGEGREGVIDGQDTLLGIGHHDAFGSAIEDHRCQPQTFLRALAGGDVGGLEAESGDRPVVVEERKANRQEVVIATSQRQGFFTFDLLAQTHRFEFALPEDLRYSVGKELQIGLADGLPGGEAESLFEPGVGKLVATSGVLDRHQRDRVVHHREQPDLCFACRTFDFVEAGIVGKQQDHAGAALRVAQQRCDVQRIVTPVGVDDLAVEGVLRVDYLLTIGDQIGHVRQRQIAQMPTNLRYAEPEQPCGCAVEALQGGFLIKHQQGVVNAVLDTFQFDIEFLCFRGLDLQFLIDRRQLFVGRLQFLVRRLEFFVRCLHFLIRGLDLLIERLHFLVRGLEFLDQRLQMFARCCQFVFEFLVRDVVAVLDGILAGRRWNPLDTDHEQRFVAGSQNRVHRKTDATIRVERLDVPWPPVRHGLLDLCLSHQHLDLGAQLATDQRDQVKSRFAGRNIEQPAGVTVNVANFELAVDQDAGRDEIPPSRLEQDVLETQRGGRFGRPQMLVQTGGRNGHLGT
ncbi:MAG: hypothetical protein AW09_000574 [Candidatus Accumulibacter phosphatis]|uniref:Uncharacterized protein n=1 Tax=Candidatus Accumulibacter phosphatis TaxID=327160 RepID=A0A080MAL2_9PROT|nr:MAG: hypothetical protein AW09_000574 [Candidatus Accumulibacter phosphatis]